MTNNENSGNNTDLVKKYNEVLTAINRDIEEIGKRNIIHNLIGSTFSYLLNRNIKEISKPQKPSAVYVPSFYVPYTDRSKDLATNVLASLSYGARMTGRTLSDIFPSFVEWSSKMAEDSMKERISAIATSAGESYRAQTQAKISSQEAATKHSELLANIENMNAIIRKSKYEGMQKAVENVIASLTEKEKLKLDTTKAILTLLVGSGDPNALATAISNLYVTP